MFSARTEPIEPRSLPCRTDTQKSSSMVAEDGLPPDSCFLATDFSLQTVQQRDSCPPCHQCLSPRFLQSLSHESFQKLAFTLQLYHKITERKTQWDQMHQEKADTFLQNGGSDTAPQTKKVISIKNSILILKKEEEEEEGIDCGAGLTLVSILACGILILRSSE